MLTDNTLAETAWSKCYMKTRICLRILVMCSLRVYPGLWAGTEFLPGSKELVVEPFHVTSVIETRPRVLHIFQC